MSYVNIFVPQADIDAAKRIAERMFPEVPDTLDAQHVIASAARIGMETLRVLWDEPDGDKKTLEGK